MGKESLAEASRIRFTRHALEKLALLRHYGFDISREQLIEAILKPSRLDERASQFFATKGIDTKHAIRVVYEKRKGYLVVITFYPVERKRYDL